MFDRGVPPGLFRAKLWQLDLNPYLLYQSPDVYDSFSDYLNSPYLNLKNYTYIRRNQGVILVLNIFPLSFSISSGEVAKPYIKEPSTSRGKMVWVSP
jgi:hypothetical protein